MLARSFSVAGLLALLFALVSVQGVNAAMAQGTVDLTRDWVVQYDTRSFATTKSFCTNFRSACVKYVGPIGENGSHHQLDCVFEAADGRQLQPGPRIHAFCGGLEKNPDGSWTNGGPVTDYTKDTVSRYFSKTAKVKGGPTSYKQCEVMRKKNPADPITCSDKSAK
ncbi:hypothetical protein JCM6882_001946 [Rhodosporidiobolus microsporus]